jgi:hypothetical protein
MDYQYKCLGCEEILDEDDLCDGTCCYCGGDSFFVRDYEPTDAQIESMQIGAGRNDEVYVAAFIDKALGAR